MSGKAAAPEQCGLLKNFFTRLGVLALAALIYAAYTRYRMYKGYDKRSFGEFGAMFFNLCAHQAVGGLLLLAYSMHEPGLDPLVWYSASFDFEFFFTMLYIKAVKQTLAPICFKAYERATGTKLYLGQVGDQSEPFVFRYFVVQFAVSVCVVGFTSRILSLSTISFLQNSYMPVDLLFMLASFYHSLPISCDAQAVLALYVKPSVLDALTFTLSDWLLSTKKTQVLPYRQPTRQKLLL
eukprot:CAMPEP_0184378142 /NCGR_PEP_ID=MMETSP0007-20130409/2820_1 /TAXON_ID=97485 /ORGANISM="Prymnesium parvum, Strain Texoma1" /LENGTH=237 /DNA_ID=CAMNT_0026722291 /DNA_START=21 /DNA_END=734 /DNA_ORIENTATION=+